MDIITHTRGTPFDHYHKLICPNCRCVFTFHYRNVRKTTNVPFPGTTQFEIDCPETFCNTTITSPNPFPKFQPEPAAESEPTTKSQPICELERSPVEKTTRRRRAKKKSAFGR